MQPYWFPYLGYFQLIGSVDLFVIYDDVNFIKGGWINRNYLLAQDDRQLVTQPLKGASQNKLINQISVDGSREKIVRTIQQNYRKAPEYTAVFPMIEEIIMQQEDNLARYLEYGLKRVSTYLGLTTCWYMSSDIEKDDALRGDEKILSICQALGATHYINAIGGEGLYRRDIFADRGLKLSFVKTKPVAYRQFTGLFIDKLSIIDVMMFNNYEQIRKMLGEYELV